MENVAKRRRRTITVFAALFIILIIFMVLDLAQAFIPLSFEEAFWALLGTGSETNIIIVWKMNLPRVVMACLIGAGLAISGGVMQALFRNPMASPYILGLSSGASLGAAIGLTFTLSWIPSLLLIPLLAFVTCMATLFLVYSIAHVGGRVPTETLLLAGIAVGSFLSALVSLLTYLAGDQMQGIIYWTMGNLTNANWNNIMIVAPLITAGCLIMLSSSRDLNAMMLGDAHAMDLGVEVKKIRLQLLVASALVTAAAVAYVGVIGFVGLVVPHILRIMIGPNNRALLPATLLGGAAFLMMCDYISRVIAPSLGILPIGIMTALIGAPYFIYLLRRRRSEMGWD
ncbi:MAG: iron ABC transporter permease [Methanomassiliicoccales archaeon]|nr:iron ABC transporter permease [Methanomassiliicoccales archaeon]TFG56027.1 MAG: iron ABC transporter permease [Methanomassiliicoccus sp.]